MRAGFARQGLGSVELPCLQQDRGYGLEIAVAGQRDEQVEKEALAVLKHLRTVVVHAWREKQKHFCRTSFVTVSAIADTILPSVTGLGPHFCKGKNQDMIGLMKIFDLDFLKANSFWCDLN